MVEHCPSCSARLDPAPTVLERGGSDGSVTSRCSNCGLVLPMIHPSGSDEHGGRSESLPIAIVDTDLSRSADEASVVDLTLLPDSPSGTRRVGHFELKSVLGQGAFGAVWLATDLNLGRQVALKLPNRSVQDSGLLHEAQTAAKLTHPNIVSVYEVGEVSGQIFIASEFIDGRTLRAELHEERPQTKRAVDVMAVVATAAHYAHEHGVIHRDMKPANVMVDKEGVPYITDFGIAKSISEDETISLDGEVVGTIAYMAPEQARGRNHLTDRRADVYAMGVMLFELLTEDRPFRGNAQGILVQKTTEDAPSPRTLVPALSRDLETICLKCLEREPEKRYETALELADELRRFLENVPIQARPISSVEKAWRWCCRNRMVSGALAFSFAVLVVALTVVSQFWSESVASEQETRSTLYRAQVNLAVSKVYDGEVMAARDLISESATASSDHSFAWHHVKRISSLFLQVVNHGSRVLDVAISNDGSMFATLGRSEIHVWNAGDGTLIRTVLAPGYEFREIEFSPKDGRLLSACSDGIARVWNPSAHDRVALEIPNGSDIRTVAFFPDGKRVITGDSDGAVRVWNLSSGELVNEALSREGSPVEGIVFSADGQTFGLLTARGISAKENLRRTVRLIRTGTLEEILETNDVPLAEGFAFEPDGQTFVVALQSGKLIRFRTDSPRAVKVLTTLREPYGAIALIPGSQLLAVASLKGRTSLHDRDLRSVCSLHTHNKSFGVLDVSRDGKFVVAGSGDGTARLIDASRFAKPEATWTGTVVRALRFTNDSQSLLFAGADGTVRKWSVFDRQETEPLWQDNRSRALLSLSVHPETGHVAACGMMRELTVTDPESSSVVAEARLPFGGYSAVTWSADGRHLIVGGKSGQILIFDSENLSDPARELSRSEGVVTAVCPLGSTNLVAVAWDDSLISLLNPQTGEIIGELPHSNGTPISMAYTNNDHLLIVGTQTGSLDFYAVRERTRKWTIRAHPALISGVAVFPDGKQLVSGGLDGDLNIWDIATGEPLAELPGHGYHRVFAVAVSPDGKTIASSGLEGDVRIWQSASD